MSQQSNPVRFVRTTAIGGLLFLLPLIVVGALVGQVVPIVMTVAEALSEIIPVKTPGGITVLVALAIAVLLLLCFGAGMLATWSLGKRLSAFFEKNIVLLFPRYAILKDQMADTIGGDHAKPSMKPVLVKFDELSRIGFETERSESAGLVAVYLPGSPDPWAGKVVLVNIDRVELLNVEFGVAAATCEQLGRGSARLLADCQSRPTPDDPQ